MPPKRKATTTKGATKSTGKKQAKQDGQEAVTKKINVPVDELFTQASDAKVHIDDDEVIYDANLNQTDVGYNSNKFYRLQILEAKGQFYCHMRWGRLGESGQKDTKGPGTFDAMFKEFGKKFRNKSGLSWANRKNEPLAGKYTFVERDYEDDDGDGDEGDDAEDDNDGKAVKKEEEQEEDWSEPESKLAPDLKSLVQLIFDEDTFNKELQRMGYNSEKLPLGKLSKSTLLKGFEYLKELEEVIEDADAAQKKRQMSQKQAIEFLSNRYYSIIPHIPARKRQPLPKIDNIDFLKREIEMLENLADMGITNEIIQETRQSKKKVKNEEPIATVDKHFSQLKLNEATPLEAESEEYQTLEKYLVNTSGHTHSLKYKIHSMFRIDREGEGDRFQEAYGSQTNSCRRLLWHGSRTTNYGGILSQGLRIAPPEAPVSGYMFGKGIYLADISTKSANYCFSGGKDHSLIMVCEAELGDPALELTNAAYDAPEQCEKGNHLSTQGLGRTVPAGWKDAGVIHESLKGILMPDPDMEPLVDGGNKGAWLQYNEYIVYDVAQVRIRYLIRFQGH